MAVTIANLEALIRKYTGDDHKVLDTKLSGLTAPGENYLGIVLRLEALLRDDASGKQRRLEAVAKCLNFKVGGPMRDMVPLQYKKELAFYGEIVPVLKTFLQDLGVEEKFDIFPELYTARRNAEDDDAGEIDKDAVLLFENLNPKGYVNQDRTIGFDLESTRFILRDIALFHAVPIALKLKNPKLFEEKIKVHLSRPDFGGPPNGEEGDEGKGSGGPPDEHDKVNQYWLEILEEFEESKPYVGQLKEIFDSMHKRFGERFKRPPSEPFATIFHSDLWTNNTMQIFKDGKVLRNKLIDFQFYSYDSPLLDLTFFLWSSVRLDIITTRFDELVEYYKEHFLEYLDRFGCDIGPFSGENFARELEKFAPFEMEHVIFMSIAIYGKKGSAAFDVEKGPGDMKKETITMEARKRVAAMVAEFGKRGWIK